MKELIENTRFVEVFNFVTLIIWIALATFAFIKLRRAKINSIVTFLWTMLILFVPVLGAASFLIVSGGIKENGVKP